MMPMSLRYLLPAALALFVGLAALAPRPLHGWVRFFDESPLSAVRTWEYWLQEYDLPRLQASTADMLVIDYSRSNPAGGAMIPFSAEQVARLKRKPDGTRRLVVAYLSIGEAEEYRYYWQPEWKSAPPAWIIGENCRWPRNHLVRFWEDGWKDIVYRGEDSYLARIQAAGFDGIYVDRIDIYDDLKSRHPEARQRMIEFMTEMAATARARTPQFLVIAQNAEDLVSERIYRRAIDGLAKEDLLYGVDGTAKRNTGDMITWSLGKLQQLQRDGKAVLAVEYLRSPDMVQATASELARLGIIGVFPPRALDGTDPLQPDPPGKAGESYGTPEYGQQNCDGVFKKS